jgi:hypothetical protein
VEEGLSSTAIKELDLDFAKLARCFYFSLHITCIFICRDIPRPKEAAEDGEAEDLGGLC